MILVPAGLSADEQLVGCGRRAIQKWLEDLDMPSELVGIYGTRTSYLQPMITPPQAGHSRWVRVLYGFYPHKLSSFLRVNHYGSLWIQTTSHPYQAAKRCETHQERANSVDSQTNHSGVPPLKFIALPYYHFHRAQALPPKFLERLTFSSLRFPENFKSI